jgi:hypothetical protein
MRIPQWSNRYSSNLPAFDVNGRRKFMIDRINFNRWGLKRLADHACRAWIQNVLEELPTSSGRTIREAPGGSALQSRNWTRFFTHWQMLRNRCESRGQRSSNLNQTELEMTRRRNWDSSLHVWARCRQITVIYYCHHHLSNAVIAMRSLWKPLSNWQMRWNEGGLGDSLKIWIERSLRALNRVRSCGAAEGSISFSDTPLSWEDATCLDNL